MPNKSRSVLNEAGIRAYARLASGVARELDGIIEIKGLKRSDVAQAASLDKAALTRILDGTRNLELRTIAAVLGALGYVMDVKVKASHSATSDGNNSSGTTTRIVKNLPFLSKNQSYFSERLNIEKAPRATLAIATTAYLASASILPALTDTYVQENQV